MSSIEAYAIAALEKVKWFRVKACVVLYLVVAVVTFGHSASGWECRAKEEVVQCDASYTPKFVFGGVFAGIFWPLYWSWVGWENVR